MFGNYTPSSWASDNCGSAGVGLACTRSNLTGDTTFNKTNNFLTNVSQLTKNYDFNPGFGGPIEKDNVWFYATFRYLGVNKTVADSFFDADPSPVQVRGRHEPAGHRRWSHPQHQRGASRRKSRQKDKVSYYHDEQDKVRGHWGIASTVPPEASAIQATPTSFVSVSKWTRTQTNKLLFDAGLAVYDQEYQENYQPDVFAGSVPLVTIIDSSTNKIANAWNNPADHFSKLFTEQFAASYVTGAHSMRFGATISQARWRLAQQWTGDVSAVTYNGLLPERQPQSGQRHAAHSDRSPQRDQERQRRVRAGQMDDQARDDQRRPALGLVHQRDVARNAAGQHLELRRSPSTAAPTASTT